MPINSLFGVDGIPTEATGAGKPARRLMRDEFEGGGDLAAADQLQAVLLAGRVEEAAADHQRGRAAAVEVDRLARPEAAHRLRQLTHGQAGLVVGAALADGRDQLPSREA